MTVSNPLIMRRFVKALKAWETDPMNLNFDNWLYRHYPHLRVNEIGDTPVMLWFSLSRCNPPREDDLDVQKHNVRVMNQIMVAAYMVAHGLDS
jgi:hypothetical protein